jgi:hypothetical protein
LIVPLIAGIVLYKTRLARPGEGAPTKLGGFTLSTKNKLSSFAKAMFVFLVVAIPVVGAADYALGQAVFSFLPAWAQNWPMVGLSFVGIGIYTVFFFSPGDPRVAALAGTAGLPP